MGWALSSRSPGTGLTATPRLTDVQTRCTRSLTGGDSHRVLTVGSPTPTAVQPAPHQTLSSVTLGLPGPQRLQSWATPFRVWLL